MMWRQPTPQERREYRQRQTITVQTVLLVVLMLLIGAQAWQRYEDSKVITSLEESRLANDRYINSLSDKVDELQQEIDARALEDAVSTSRGGAMVRLRVDEMRELARTVHAEAQGESSLGKMLVAKVAINRYRWNPGKTMHEILTNPNAFATGDTYTEADMDAVRAAMQDSTYDHLSGFHNPDTATNPETKGRTIVLKVGNHVFW